MQRYEFEKNGEPSVDWKCPKCNVKIKMTPELVRGQALGVPIVHVGCGANIVSIVKNSALDINNTTMKAETLVEPKETKPVETDGMVDESTGNQADTTDKTKTVHRKVKDPDDDTFETEVDLDTAETEEKVVEEPERGVTALLKGAKMGCERPEVVEEVKTVFNRITRKEPASDITNPLR